MGFMKFLWNKEEKKFCGRNATSWAEIGIYYTFYYSCLMAFFGASVSFFYATLSPDEPSLIGEASILDNKPGMGYRPYLVGKSNLINIKKEYMKEIVESIKTELTLNDQTPMDVEHCTEANKFGYESDPCVLLKLNKIFGFKPKAYKEKPKDLIIAGGANGGNGGTGNGGNGGTANGGNGGNGGNSSFNYVMAGYTNDMVWVHCNGVDARDKDQFVGMEYLPRQGFPLKHYPFKNGANYTTPFVFLKLTNLPKYKLVNIECRVFAENIPVDKIEKHGYLRFHIVKNIG